MKDDKTFEKVYSVCNQYDFDRETTAQMCWNEGYALGRKRWHWGPAWMVSLAGWFNTQISRLKGKGLTGR
jgi:hypothetical protein